MIRKWDIAVIAALLLLTAALFFFLYRAPGEVLIVEADGTVVDRVDLSALPEETEKVYTTPYGEVRVRMGRDGAQVVWADCPNHYCVNTGKISRAGQSILCLPARICLRLSGGGEDVDGVTG